MHTHMRHHYAYTDAQTCIHSMYTYDCIRPYSRHNSRPDPCIRRRKSRWSCCCCWPLPLPPGRCCSSLDSTASTARTLHGLWGWWLPTREGPWHPPKGRCACDRNALLENSSYFQARFPNKDINDRKLAAVSAFIAHCLWHASSLPAYDSQQLQCISEEPSEQLWGSWTALYE